jgi:hypothetical protein
VRRRPHRRRRGGRRRPRPAALQLGPGELSPRTPGTGLRAPRGGRAAPPPRRPSSG